MDQQRNKHSAEFKMPKAHFIPYAEQNRPAKKRLGFLQGQFGDPAKVKEVGCQEILAMFEDGA